MVRQGPFPADPTFDAEVVDVMIQDESDSLVQSLTNPEDAADELSTPGRLFWFPWSHPGNHAEEAPCGRPAFDCPDIAYVFFLGACLLALSFSGSQNVIRAGQPKRRKVVIWDLD